VTDPGPAVPAGSPACEDLTARVFRALYAQFDLHHAGGTYVVTPKGTPLLASRSLGDIARQLTTRPLPGLPPARTTPRPHQERPLRPGSRSPLTPRGPRPSLPRLNGPWCMPPKTADQPGPAPSTCWLTRSAARPTPLSETLPLAAASVSSKIPLE
jgi:hypothetical protein